MEEVIYTQLQVGKGDILAIIRILDNDEQLFRDAGQLACCDGWHASMKERCKEALRALTDQS